MKRTLPRPASVSLLVVVLTGMMLVNVIRGFLALNTRLLDHPAGESILQSFLGPFFSAICIFFLQKARRFARPIFWLGYGGVAIWLVSEYPTLDNGLRAGVWAIGSIVLALPNAHWYFRGKDYRRRQWDVERVRLRAEQELPQEPGRYRY